MKIKIQKLNKSRINIITHLLVLIGMISQLIIFPSIYASEEKSHFGVQGAVAKFSREMKEAGIQITREWIEWGKIEPIKGRYNWEEMDKKVREANQSDIEILGYFVHMPSWAK